MNVLSRLRRRYWPESFRLPYEPFGFGDTERCIEIPWAVSCFQEERRVLDVGYANAEDRYLRELVALRIPELYGLDRAKKDIAGIIPVIGDIRKTGFPEGFFDLVFCISTIEHVGRDNSIYFADKDPADEQGDFAAMKELSRITRKRGRIAITVPYGRYHDYGWFIQYDRARLKMLTEASDCKILRQSYFIYEDGWRSCPGEGLKGVLYKDNDAPAAAGLACVLLQR